MKTFLKSTPFLILLAAILVTGCSDTVREQKQDMTLSDHQSIRQHSGHLPPCPDRPNCVSSEAAEGTAHVAPLPVSGSVPEAWQTLQDILVAMDGQIEEVDEQFLHATFRSRIFRFVDDLTCRLDHDNNRIQVRSASRVGYSDFEVNRKRVERLRTAFQKRLGNASEKQAA